MDKILDVPIFLEFYSELLTERQAEIIALYCDEDYSLAEIAENLQISRQAVHDSLKSGMAAFEELEEKMGLVRKHNMRMEIVEDIIKTLTAPDFIGSGDRAGDKVDFIVSRLNEFIEI